MAQVDLEIVPASQNTSASPSKTTVILTCLSKITQIHLAHPFTPAQDTQLKWYLQDYASTDPFEVTKAEQAAESLTKYGCSIARQIWDAGIIPVRCKLSIRVLLGSGSLAAPSAALQALHWEILEDLALWPADAQLELVVLRRVLPLSSGAFTTQSVPRGPTNVLNVLMVVARPNHDDDINHRLISLPFIEAISKLPQCQGAVVVNPFFVRPATWDAFVQQLDNQEDGFYQLVHFDMHGVLKKVRGEITAFLNFIKFSNRSRHGFVKDRVGAATVAEVLVTHGVKVVILNACESAKAGGEVGNSENLAEVFVRAGVPTVIAMAYQIVARAAEIFMTSLYDSLLVRGQDISDAVLCARAALAKDPARKGRFGHEVMLQDAIVPVLYQYSGSVFQLPRPSLPPPRTGGWLSWMASVLWKEPKKDDLALFGRDINILDLEMQLLHRKLVFLHGPGGCGKSTFLEHTCWWWKVTKFIEEYLYFDLAKMRETGFTFDFVLAEIGEKLLSTRAPTVTVTEENVIEFLRCGRCLIVFDSLEATTTFEADKVSVTQADQDRLRSFLAKVQEGKTFILLSSREPRCWLAADVNYSYRLGGLPLSSAIQFADKIARANRHGSPVWVKDRVSMEFLENVLRLLEGNPLAIETVFLHAQAAVNPADLYHNILAGDVKLQFSGKLADNRFLRTMEAMKADLAEREKITALGPFQFSSLSAFWGIFPGDLRVFFWFTRPFSSMDTPVRDRKDRWLSLVQSSAQSEYDFIVPWLLSYLVGAGVIEPAKVATRSGYGDMVQATGLSDLLPGIPSSSSSSEEWYHPHPLFTLWVRDKILTEGKRAMCRTALVDFITFRETQYEEAIESVSWGSPIHVQHRHFCYVNLIAALGMSLNTDLNSEITLHGVDYPLLLIKPLFGVLFHQTHLRAVLHPYLKRHLDRFFATKLLWVDGVPLPWALGRIFSLALNLLQTDKKTFEELLPKCLHLADRFLSAGHRMDLTAEMAWFELRFNEGLLAQDAGRTIQARQIFERNMRDDPVQQNPLVLHAVKQIQVRNLHSWTAIILQQGLPAGESAASGSLGPERLRDNMLRMAQTSEFAGLRNMPFIAAYDWLLGPNRDVISTFGRMVTMMLAEPVQNMDIIPGGFEGAVGAPPLSGAGDAMDAMFEAVEVQLRIQGGDTERATQLLEVMLERATEGEWRLTSYAHSGLHEIAFKAGDWKKAIIHLDAAIEVLHGQPPTEDPKIQCTWEMKYTECYDKLGSSHTIATLKHLAAAVRWAEAGGLMMLLLHDTPGKEALLKFGSQTFDMRDLSKEECSLLRKLIDLQNNLRQAFLTGEYGQLVELANQFHEAVGL